jgi:MFS family permease
MRDVALAWQIYLLTHSPIALGLLAAFKVVPVIVLALGGGVMADAFDRRRVMIVTQTIMAATSAALALLTASGRATTGHLYALVAISAATTAFDNPARQSLVVNLLPAKDLPNGLALGITGWQVATVVGPAIGGLMLGAGPIESIYVVDAVSFAAVIGALLVIRPRSDATRAPEGGRTRGDMSFRAALDGLRFLASQRQLIALMLIDFLATFFAGSMLLLPIFANEVFLVGARGLGLLASAPAVGALVTSVWLSSRGPIRRQGATVLVAVVAYGACIAGFGLSRSFPLALLLLAGSGAADTVSTVVRQVVRQTLTPDDLRGRMNAINMIFFMSGPQLGEVEAGFLAALTTPRISVVSGGLACIVVASVVSAAVPALRRLRDAGAAGESPAVGS